MLIQSHFFWSVPVLIVLHAGNHAQKRNEQVDYDPQNHLGHLGLRKELTAKLDVHDELGDGDADKHPGLRSEAFAAFVSDVGVVLTCGRSGHEAAEEDAGHANGMLRWHGEDMLDEKSVELHYLP